MPRRIIRMNHNDAARARSDGLLQGMKINFPAVVIKERISNKFYVLNIGKKIEERIAGSGNQQFIPRIAEQAENERIRLTGAGCEKDIFDGNVAAARGVVFGDSSTRRCQTARFRLVDCRRWTRKRPEDRVIVVHKSAFGGIRDREVK